jgi:hypothetical protein
VELVADIVMSVTIQGGTDLTSAIQKAISGMTDELAGPLVEEAHEILAVSKELVPVDQGILRASADVVGVNPSREASGILVRFGYGGAASSYALLQHETPPEVFTHAPGKSWKYLERPVYEASATMGPRLAGRLAARFSQKLAGGVGGGGEVFVGS